MNCFGTTPPVIVSANSKPAPRGRGLISTHDVAELAMAARLLLVAAADLRCPCGSSPCRAPGRCWRSTVDAVLALQPLERDAQMHLALPQQQHLMRVRVRARARSEGSSSISLASAAVSFTSSLRSLRPMPTPNTGSGGRRSLHLHDAALLGGDRLAGPDLLEAAERDGIAGLGRPALRGSSPASANTPATRSSAPRRRDDRRRRRTRRSARARPRACRRARV